MYLCAYIHTRFQNDNLSKCAISLTVKFSTAEGSENLIWYPPENQSQKQAKIQI